MTPTNRPISGLSPAVVAITSACSSVREYFVSGSQTRTRGSAYQLNHQLIILEEYVSAQHVSPTHTHTYTHNPSISIFVGTFMYIEYYSFSKPNQPNKPANPIQIHVFNHSIN